MYRVSIGVEGVHDMSDVDPGGRRKFLRLAAVTGTGLLVAGPAAVAAGEGESGEVEASPGEDLMQEHGVLKRVLLVYGEAIRRIDANQDLPPDPILDAARLVREFVEEYHERQEEDFLFPRFRKANVLTDLVGVLLQQHQGGRKLTDLTIRYANVRSLREDDERRRLRDSMAEFVRMYNPHEAREDTVLFPSLRTILSPRQVEALGERMEEDEHKVLGDEGFERSVEQVAVLEKRLGIYDLKQFTPRV
jgi:hemerythrin-like domain-containing protein